MVISGWICLEASLDQKDVLLLIFSAMIIVSIRCQQRPTIGYSRALNIAKRKSLNYLFNFYLDNCKVLQKLVPLLQKQ